jgi:hypothetical protein
MLVDAVNQRSIQIKQKYRFNPHRLATLFDNTPDFWNNIPLQREVRCQRTTELFLWLTRLVVQSHFRDARCDIEAGRPLDTHRLQGNRIPGTANQHIGTKPDPDRRASRRPGVGPG